MHQIFWGLLFLLFDINVSSHSIDVLPDFIGWILIAVGMKKLSQHSKVFNGMTVMGIIMTLISAFQTVIYFLGEKRFAYTYAAKQFSVSNSDSVFIINTAFWILKLSALTIAVLALAKIKDRISDTKSIKRFRCVWFSALGIEIFAYLYRNLIMSYLPESAQKAVIQILVIGVIFFKIWFLFDEFKIAKDYKPY